MATLHVSSDFSTAVTSGYLISVVVCGLIGTFSGEAKGSAKMIDIARSGCQNQKLNNHGGNSANDTDDGRCILSDGLEEAENIHTASFVF